MGNFIEFILKLNDLLTPGMQKAAAAAETSASKITRAMGQPREAMGRFTQSIGESKNSLDNLGNAWDGFTSKIIKGQVIGNAITGALKMGFEQAKEFISGSLSSAMDMAITKKSFEVLTGDKAVGLGLATDIKKFVNDSVFGPELYKDAQTMMGFGIATKDVMKDLHMLGDVSMGNAERMGALTLAFSQTTAAGRLMGQDLLQYINAGFNPLQVMSEKWQQFGFKSKQTVGQLKDLMSQGGISSDMVAKAFELATGEGGKFNHMLDQIAETSGGKWAKFTGNWEGFKVDMGDALMPLADVGIGILNNMMNVANDALPSVSRGVGYLIDQMNDINSGNSEWSRWVDIIKTNGLALWDTVKKIASDVWHIASGMLDSLKKSELLKDVAAQISGSFQAALWFIQKIGAAISWAYDKFIAPTFDRIELVYRMAKSVFGGRVSSEALGGSGKTIGTAPPVYVPNTKVPGKDNQDPLKGNQDKPPGINTTKASEINSGGQRTITITIGKQIESFHVHTTNIKEGVNELGQLVREELRRVLNSINGIAVN